MSFVRKLSCAALLCAGATASAAIVEGRTNDGRSYVAGGIGIEEVETLRQQAAAYSLQLITAARSGAYLANQHVRIHDAGGRVVFDTPVAGPWLLVDLPPGVYRVQVTYGGQTLERRVSLGGTPQRVVIHFDVAVDTPESVLGLERQR